MQRLRSLILADRQFAFALLVLAFCIKAVIPAGYMISPSKDLVLTVSICADATGGTKQMQIVLPGKDQGGNHSDSGKKEGQCAFSGLTNAAVSGATPVLLALAFAIMLVLGLSPARSLPIAQFAHTLPPLRGPPSAA